MAALPNREAAESEFARAVASAFADYRTLLGAYAARKEPVPDSVWIEIEFDLREKLTAILLLLFVSSGIKHGLTQDIAQNYAAIWAGGRASTLASGIVANSRGKVESLDQLETTFSIGRAGSIAATETTVATSAGSEQAIILLVGKSLLDTWYTENDGRVCSVCGPLHGTDRSQWELFHSDGPPAHPGCRCWIEYESEKK